MNASDERTIEEWGRRLEHTVTIEAILGEDEQSRSMAGFCDQITRLAPKVTVKRQNDDTPGLRVAPNILYQAVPETRELDLFLKILDGGELSAGGMIKPPDPEKIERLAAPVRIEVFVSSHCPFCPHVVAALLSLAKAAPLVALNVIDGTLFTEKAASSNIKSVPTVILNNDFRWTGQVNMNEIVDVAVSGEDADFGVDTLRAIVEGGNAETVAKMMLEKGVLYAAFIDLLTDEKWSVRLGAMVAFEYIAEGDEGLTGQAIDALWNRFEKVDNSVKGDILHLYGESRRQDAREKLKTVLDGDYAQEVKEAAREALA